ncbi:MAG: hypothetical protein HQL50_03620 [Magnetococcales bacterium]|nr:hypothetical protein [Magnetococcales bacterium]
MNKDELLQKLDATIAEAENWPVKGWKIEFGPYRNPICSLKEAEELPEEAHNRLEAINYWAIVKRTGEETVAYGKKARAALEAGDVDGAKKSVYFSMFKEKQLLERTTTWGPIFQALS